MKNYKGAFLNIGTILFGFLLALIFVEITFRLLPVSDSIPLQEVNDENPYLRFSPNQELNISIGKSFDIRTKKYTNAQGFFDNIKIDNNFSGKKIGVIGDSYVEAIHVGNSDTIHGQLGQLLGPTYAVNGVGASGSALSQYVAYAQFLRKELNPDLFVFVVVGNDFDESLLRYKKAGGFHFYDDNFNLVRLDWKPKRVNQILRQSATFRFFRINMSGYDFFSIKNSDDKKYLGNTLRTVDLERITWSRKAVDAFLSDISKIANGKKIIIVIDADRYGIYTNQIDRSSFFSQMRAYLIQQSKKTDNIVAVDLEEFFLESYKKDQQKFEFDTDSHWNEFGHKLAAEAVASLIKTLDAN